MTSRPLPVPHADGTVPISALFYDDESTSPSGDALSALLDAGIAGLSELRVPTVADHDEELVPIGELVYSPRAALLRAVQLSAELKARHTTPDVGAFDELHDLLHLAAAE